MGMRKLRSKTKKKILLVLLAGVAISMSRSPRKTGYILRRLPRELRNIEKEHLHRCIKEFKSEKLISYREDEDGNVTLELSRDGERHALTYSLESMELEKPLHWDKRWRIVMFDIPEKKHAARDALREKLRSFGFYELQRSVWVHPYPCEKEIEFIVEVFEIRHYVRYAELSNLTNEEELRLHFKL